MVNLVVAKAVSILHFGEFFNSVLPFYLPLFLASLVVSLEMTEFSVPEFAHLGRRVILKVSHTCSL